MATIGRMSPHQRRRDSHDMTRRLLALVRHTRADVSPGICYGRLDIAAVPDPEAFSRICCEVGMVRPRRLLSSPARRCAVLAEAIATRLGLTVGWDDRLLELDFGDWEGRPWESVPRDQLDAWAADPLGFAPPGGERGAALVARTAAVFEDLAAQAGARGIVAHAIVAHAGPLRILKAFAIGRFNDLAGDLVVPGPPLGSVQTFSFAAARPEP
jgi:alpha-ribazole phosphatase